MEEGENKIEGRNNEAEIWWKVEICWSADLGRNNDDDKHKVEAINMEDDTNIRKSLIFL